SLSPSHGLGGWGRAERAPRSLADATGGSLRVTRHEVLPRNRDTKFCRLLATCLPAAVRDRQADDPLLRDLLRGVPAQLPALQVRDDPLQAFRIEHDKDILSFMNDTDIKIPVVDRHQP